MNLPLQIHVETQLDLIFLTILGISQFILVNLQNNQF